MTQINHPVWCDGCRAWRAHTLKSAKVLECLDCGRVTDNSDEACQQGRHVVTEDQLLIWAQDHYCCPDCRRRVHGLLGPFEGAEVVRPAGS